MVGAAFLGVGAMVGAGIFALLGEAGAIAGSAVWLSFMVAGLIAGLLGYTVAKLGVRYPSSGGLIAYLIEAFGKSHLTGVASWLFYFAGLIVTAMVAVSFGSYGVSLFLGDDAAGGWANVLTSAVVVGMVAVNAVGAGTVAKVQSVIVVVLLAVFTVFIAVTIADADWDLLAPSTYPSAADIVASVALTFFAYLGFAVISFTAANLRDPAKELPRAMYLGDRHDDGDPWSRCRRERAAGEVPSAIDRHEHQQPSRPSDVRQQESVERDARREAASTLR